MVVAGGTALFAAAVLTGCGSDPDPDYQGVCVDKTTQTRVDDDECDESHRGGGHGFVYFPAGRRYPPIGGRIASYPGSVSTPPSGHTGLNGGASASGGTVSKSSVKQAAERGGFGKTSRGSSGSVGG